MKTAAKVAAAIVIIAVLAVILAGCGEQGVRVDRQDVPVAVPCLDDATWAKIGAPPAYRSNAELAGMTDEELVLRVAAERDAGAAWAAKAWAALVACHSLPSQAPTPAASG